MQPTKPGYATMARNLEAALVDLANKMNAWPSKQSIAAVNACRAELVRVRDGEL